MFIRDSTNVFVSVLFPNHWIGGTSRRRENLKTDSHKFYEHLGNKLNPSFPVDMTQSRTVKKTKCDKKNKFKMVLSFIMISPSIGFDFAAHTVFTYKGLQLDISKHGYRA